MGEIERTSEIISEISFCDWAHEHELCTYKSTGCSDCEISQAKLKALDALHEKAERDNPQPLTLDELREMGKPNIARMRQTEAYPPVWVETIIDGKISCQISRGLIRIDNRYKPPREFVDAHRVNLMLADYGKTWLAYRHKPKEAKL